MRYFNSRPTRHFLSNIVSGFMLLFGAPASLFNYFRIPLWSVVNLPHSLSHHWAVVQEYLTEEESGSWCGKSERGHREGGGLHVC